MLISSIAIAAAIACLICWLVSEYIAAPLVDDDENDPWGL